jgi:hypothetical protein
MYRWTFVLIAIALPPLGVSSEEAPKPSVTLDHPPLLDFARKNPDCLAFSDLCYTCVRASNQSIQCSTPGIACVPQPWFCTQPKPKT